MCGGDRECVGERECGGRERVSGGERECVWGEIVWEKERERMCGG